MSSLNETVAIGDSVYWYPNDGNKKTHGTIVKLDTFCLDQICYADVRTRNGRLAQVSCCRLYKPRQR